MSNPKNPLADSNTFSAAHVLLAFSSSEAAMKYTIPKDQILGNAGERVPQVQCGEAFVIVNELSDFSYVINQLEWSFDYFSPLVHNTTISAGSFVVTDVTGDQFPTFLRGVAKQLGVAQTKITFVLFTSFIQNSITGPTDVIINLNPLIFSMVDLSSGYHVGVSNMFNVNFNLMYNTVGQMPNTVGLNQFTVTSSENSPAKSVPAPSTSTLGILSRKEEDKLKNNLRKTRFGMSRPMRTLKELFAGFESELKEMRYSHKGQLQEFGAIIRPAGVKKLKTPKPKKVKEGHGLPIDYTVTLDPAFADYAVDNRNLLTEQTEVAQSSAGIVSITIPPGASIYEAVDIMMKTSSAVGKDAMNGYGYKTVVTSMYDCEGVMKNTVIIKRYQIPKNKQDVVDTGLNAESKPNGTDDKKITFELAYITDVEGREGNDSKDVIYVTFATATATESSVMDEDADEAKGERAFSSSQREAISFERSDTVDFMKSGFAGLRPSADPMNFGAESAIDATYVDTLAHRLRLAQTTITNVVINGNSDLYSDLARNPDKVAKGLDDGARLFRLPEVLPMYLRLRIKLVNRSNSDDSENYWYYTYHYHLAGVTNSIVRGKFIQTLRLLSTDDVI